MGLMARLFGSEKALESIVTSVSNGLDSLVYTDEEKAARAAEATTEARLMVVEWMKATQGQNLSRRIIALAVTALYIMLFVAGTVTEVWAVLNLSTGPSALSPDHIKAITSIFDKKLELITNAFMLILGFYFAAPHMTAIVNKFSNGYTKRSE